MQLRTKPKVRTILQRYSIICNRSTWCNILGKRQLTAKFWHFYRGNRGFCPWIEGGRSILPPPHFWLRGAKASFPKTFPNLEIFTPVKSTVFFCRGRGVRGAANLRSQPHARIGHKSNTERIYTGKRTYILVNTHGTQTIQSHQYHSRGRFSDLYLTGQHNSTLLQCLPGRTHIKQSLRVITNGISVSIPWSICLAAYSCISEILRKLYSLAHSVICGMNNVISCRQCFVIPSSGVNH